MADVRKRVTKSGEVRWDVRYRDQALRGRFHGLQLTRILEEQRRADRARER